MNDPNTPYAIVIGGANMDISGAPAGELILRDSNPGSLHISPGGVARNIAENMARLGINCKLITALGNDQFAELIIAAGREAGINMDHVIQLDEQKTSTYLCVLDHNGDMFVALNDMTIIDALLPDQIDKNEIEQASLIVADTNLCEETLGYLAQNSNGTPLFIDAVSTRKVRRIKPFLSSIHSLKLNRMEAAALSAMDGEKLAEMAAYFHGYGVNRVFITLGPEGVFYSDGNEQGSISTTPVKVINASGAGDAFVAALAYAYLKSMDLKNTVKFALCAANIALAHAATINPDMSLKNVSRKLNNEFGSD